jgi:hypothetical protein
MHKSDLLHVSVNYVADFREAKHKKNEYVKYSGK